MCSNVRVSEDSHLRAELVSALMGGQQGENEGPS